MTLLQIGYPKSGNYWLYTMLKHMLNEGGIPDKSFIRHQPIYHLAKDWKLSYPEQVAINMIDIFYQASFYRISSKYRCIIKNMQEYVQSNRQVWTHSNFCERSREVFPLFDKIVYIIRDPRDILLSEARFAFSPYMQEYWPSVYQSEDEYLHQEAFKLGKRWKKHVRDYVDHAEAFNIHIVFYERLRSNLPAELDRLSGYLELDLNQESKNRIMNAVDFNAMKQTNPQHLHKGCHYSWKKNLHPGYAKAIGEDASILLQYLGYPMQVEEESIPLYK